MPLQVKPGLYDQASAAYQRGDYPAAVQLLRAHLTSHPDDMAAHYALGLSTTALGDYSSAEAEYRWVVRKNPNHVEAPYRLAVILHDTAGTDPARLKEAEALFLRALPRIPAARERLQAIRATLHPQRPSAPPRQDDVMQLFTPSDGSHARVTEAQPAHSVASSPGSAPPRSLAADLDEGNFAEPGVLRHKTLRAARSYGRAWLLAALMLLAAAVTKGQASRANALPVPAGSPAGASQAANMLAVLLMLAAAVVVAGILLRAYTTRYVLHARRLDLTRGILSRQRNIIWYYDITDISYQRSLLNILTNTAGLKISYDAGGSQPKDITMPGLATARQASKFYEEIQQTALRERRAMKKQFV
jgi:tetratricopeptide (TPR) repeat protein